MSKKGYKQTEEHKSKIGITNSRILKKKWATDPEFRKRMGKVDRTFKHTKKAKEKIVEALKGRPVSDKTRSKIGKSNAGKKNGNYGKRTGTGWLAIKRQALERDNYTCQHCGIDDKEVLCVDHIIPRSVKPEWKCKLDNVMTLCANCHMKKSKRERRNKIY